MTPRIKIKLWLQKPPRVQWVLRLTLDARDRKVVVRTWFHEYGPSTPPPPCVTIPAAMACRGIAAAALQGPALDATYSVDA